MELRRLRYFLRIAAEGSLGKASRALGVAQPALGRHVQMLESELGVKLFRRVSKGMQLTDEGEYLKEALEHPLELVNSALRNVRSFAGRVEASLNLGLPPEIAQVLGPRVVRRLRKDLPNLSLKVVEGDSSKLAADLSHGLVDIAILVAILPDDKIFHAEVLSEQLMLVAPPGSAVARRESVVFGELCNFPLILPGTQAGLRIRLEKAALTADINLNIALEIDATELTKQAVRDELGYAILSPVAFKAEAERAELVGIPIVDPEIDQLTRWAVRPHWPVSRSTYDAIESAIFEEWLSAVSSGDWPAKWLFDLSQLGLAIIRPQIRALPKNPC
jgi:LysR family transcriptional regulator, nitrogen assimilation regulatory protein